MRLSGLSIAVRRRGVSVSWASSAVLLAAWASASACGGLLAPGSASGDGNGNPDASPRSGADAGVMDAPAGGELQDGSADVPLAPDADDGSPCAACMAGAVSCRGGGVATCVEQDGGCPRWGASSACPPNQSCVTSGQDGGACACNPGYTLVGGVCELGGPVPPPRPVAPLSTATVTSQTPVFKWSLASGSDGAMVDICRDRRCTKTVVSFSAAGSSGKPPSALSAGLYYWRLHGTLSGVPGSATSPVWELFVGPRSAPVDTSWGSTLDVDGDGFADVAVGAPQANNQAGAVYVYRGGPAGLSGTPATLPSQGGPPSEFGLSMASAGDVNGDGFADLIVGGPSAMAYAGAAYVYLGGPGGLSTTPLTLPSLGGPSSEFGYAVAGAGDVNADGYADVIVGESSSDAAYVYLGSASGPSPSPLMLVAPVGSVHFGRVVAAAGDVNGDGFADVLVAAPESSDGDAYLYVGKAGGLSGPKALAGPATGYILTVGISTAGIGDVNGDGFADVLVESAGAEASLYLGGSSGLSASPAMLPLGYMVAGAGDVNGDGFADALVGEYQPTSQDAGVQATEVFLGGASGLSATPEPLTVPGASLWGGGYVVASAGDVNGDGYAEILVGAPSSTTNGGAYLFYGAAAGVSPMPGVALADTTARTGFGASLASIELGARGLEGLLWREPFVRFGVKGESLCPHGPRSVVPSRG